MNMECEHTVRARGTFRRVIAACVTIILIAALSACGSSKPAYCSNRTSLENSVKGLTSLNTSGGVVSALRSQLTKIQSEATALVSSAKSDFPSETTAVTSSVNALESTVKSFPSSPSAANIAALASQVSSVVTSVKSFTDSTSSKCN